MKLITTGVGVLVGFLFVQSVALALKIQAAVPTPQAPSPLLTAALSGKQVVFSRTDGEKAPPPLKISVSEPEILGVLQNDRNGSAKPYVLVSGYECDQCSNRSEKKFVYLIRSDGKVARKFVSPGEIRERKDRQVVYSSQAFFGRCFANKGPVYVDFRQEKVDRRRFLQSNVLMVELEGDQVVEKLVTTRLPSISKVKPQVDRKQCQKIAGFTRTTVDFNLTSPIKDEVEENAEATAQEGEAAAAPPADGIPEALPEPEVAVKPGDAPIAAGSGPVGR